MKTTKKLQWTTIEWPFDSKYAAKLKRDEIAVYALKVDKGRIILVDTPEKHYVASFGPDSERSFSGCFYQMRLTLAEAKAEIERKLNEGEI